MCSNYTQSINQIKTTYKQWPVINKEERVKPKIKKEEIKMDKIN